MKVEGERLFQINFKWILNMFNVIINYVSQSNKKQIFCVFACSLLKLNDDACHVVTTNSSWWCHIWCYDFIEHLLNHSWYLVLLLYQLICEVYCFLWWQAIPDTVTGKDQELAIWTNLFSSNIGHGREHLVFKCNTCIVFVL